MHTSVSILALLATGALTVAANPFNVTTSDNSTSTDSNTVAITNGTLTNGTIIGATLANGTQINGTFSAGEATSTTSEEPSASAAESSSAAPSGSQGETSAPAAQATDLGKRAGNSGQGTYYDVGLGACGNTNSNSEMVAAMNAPQYDGGGGLTRRGVSASCGKKLCVTGPKGQTSVTVVDKCPGCSQGDLDLSPAAFNQIADPAQGRVPITWSEC